MTPADLPELDLRADPVADVGHLLKEGGRHELEAEIERLAGQGHQAHVVVTPAGQDLGAWQTIWETQGFHSEQDLLVLFNGSEWQARGWGLEPGQVRSALAQAEPALQQYYGRGLVSALANLGDAAGVPAPVSAATPAPGVRYAVLGALSVVVAGMFAWVVARRANRRRVQRKSLADARDSADAVLADVLLSAEELSGPDAAHLRAKAALLFEQLRGWSPAALDRLADTDAALTVARLEQVENEVEALRSRVLQLKRRTEC